jgi:hypothetical protein
MSQQLAKAASEVAQALRQPPQVKVRQARFAALAAEVSRTIRRQTAAVDREAEWQRVHSYIADVLKDTHVLYAKLARLEGNFAGEELSRLERISEAMLTLGNELSSFSKAFYEGKYDMAQSEFTYGNEGDGGGAPAEEAPPVDMGAEGGDNDTAELERALAEGQGQGQEQGQGQGQGQEEEQQAQEAAQ